MDQIAPLRKQINEIDDSLLTLLEARFKLVKAVWDIKKANRINLRDPKAELKLIEELKSKAKFNPILVETIYTKIFQENDRLYNN